MKPRTKNATIEIYCPSELAREMKKHNLTQKKLCEIMGLSKKSYTLIGRYLKGKQDIATTIPWEKLNKYIKGNKPQ